MIGTQMTQRIMISADKNKMNQICVNPMNLLHLRAQNK